MSQTEVDMKHSAAAEVSEYLCLASHLRKTSSPADYRRANELSLKLAMYLPAAIYRIIVQAVAAPTAEANLLTATIAVRAWLLEDAAGDLLAADLAFHAPGAGEKR